MRAHPRALRSAARERVRQSCAIFRRRTQRRPMVIQMEI
jgi:hypothetical protein